MRTNIEIDDKLMKQAMKATGSRTKRAAVEASLRQTVQLKRQEGIRGLFGKVAWRGHDDDWLVADEEILRKNRGTDARTAPGGRKPPAAAEERATSRKEARP